MSTVTRRPDVVIRDLRDLASAEAIEPEWSALWERCGGATTFQRPEWLLPWMRHFPLHEPWVVEARREGRLVGLAPLFVYHAADERVIAPVGAGITDYLDVLVEDNDPQALNAMLERLATSDRVWHMLDLLDLPRTSPLLRARLPAGWNGELTLHDDCPVLYLPSAVEHLGRAVPGRQLAHLARARRRAARARDIAVEVATPETLCELLDALLRVHGARWQERGGHGMLSAEPVQAFHREVAAALLGRGVLRLYGLRFDGHIVAALYAFFEARAGFCYLQGFDPAFHELSPGLMIIGAVVEDAVRRGLRSLDFLRGREAYKYAWGARDEPTFRLRVRRR